MFPSMRPSLFTLLCPHLTSLKRTWTRHPSFTPYRTHFSRPTHHLLCSLGTFCHISPLTPDSPSSLEGGAHMIPYIWMRWKLQYRSQRLWPRLLNNH
ncbi:hypothetical protein EV421DRAFT_957148 [Armillaria borealis]|uniref:Uncharacterized protein n=1 Tax=Armillaria borealis TaxID=47425 RepID=A0AA39JAZ9_9AGAR|nr:hypothetical protein EV421DRAFT_1138679 [Armillaria borealis]KAK0438660.1 hypothetical protein EV421DRAFT_957148 [Armillaria borealis]